MAVTLRRYRFTVDEYERLAQAGVLTQCDRVELLDGEIVEMSPIGERHAGVVARISSVFSERLGRRCIVWGQNPVQLRVVRSMPQPDIALLRTREDFYTTTRPGPDDALLVIEVMDTSAATDRGVKLPLYARAGIVETWLVDLGGDAIEVYRQPAATGYGDTRVVRRGERITPRAFPDLTLAVDELLG
ncbi:MAG: Uma2 family endonuclease [Candidatus Rokubacteria bacterium]|nr:Uma2 family endonuclease [Candidatus Rokubacteria bacterium]